MICRSRKGAWIEMQTFCITICIYAVAPVRERGLKFSTTKANNNNNTVAPVRERGLK